MNVRITEMVKEHHLNDLLEDSTEDMDTLDGIDTSYFNQLNIYAKNYF